MNAEKIRESVIAGSWYPGRPETLRKDIQRYLERAKVAPLTGELIGLIAPHAGYVYSGGVAAYAYKLLMNRPFDRVVIIAPSHRAYFQGTSVYKLGGYRTPLGIVPLDRELVDSLLQQPISIDYVPQAHAQEHSLEIQLPFLQVVLQDFKMTPLVMGEQSLENCQKLADAIVNICAGKRVLLVASSDLSHFHSYSQAKQLDQVVLDRVEAFDPVGLSQELKKGNCEACGGGPMVTVMLAAKKLGANKSKVLHYANSGDVTGDNRSVVGYMSAVFYNNPGGLKKLFGKKQEKIGVDLGLSDEDKQALREMAYEAIRCRLRNEPLPDVEPRSEKLKEPRGAFVCLKKGGDLRGCIGMVEARGPLYETVRDMAIQAAFADPRFPALEAGEFDQIDLEISVLTPMQRVTDPSQIEIGKHGLSIKKGYHSGLLLPQVATENGWTREQFLEWTCRKASLPPDAWKSPDAEIYVFSADVF